MGKKALSEPLWTVNILKDPKHYLNVHGSIFAILFYNSEKKCAGKILS